MKIQNGIDLFEMLQGKSNVNAKTTDALSINFEFTAGKFKGRPILDTGEDLSSPRTNGERLGRA